MNNNYENSYFRNDTSIIKLFNLTVRSYNAFADFLIICPIYYLETSHCIQKIINLW